MSDANEAGDNGDISYDIELALLLHLAMRYLDQEEDDVPVPRPRGFINPGGPAPAARKAMALDLAGPRNP